jgi:predicted transcriptional regulator
MKLNEIGAHVCIDWDAKEHKEWLLSLIKKLMQEGMIERVGKRYVLSGNITTS